MLEMMVELQDARIMFKKNLLRVAMFKKRLGMYKEIFELLLQEMLQMFSATIVVRKKDETGVILSNEHNDFLIADVAQIEEIHELKFIEADRQAKRLATELQNQFILDRDKIRALEKERDDLQLNVSKQRKQVLELQTAQTSFKHKMNANEDKYLDDVLNLEAKLKKNENVVIKMSNSVQALFMLGPKPLSVYDPQLKHGLGYENPLRSRKQFLRIPSRMMLHIFIVQKCM
ncbi:hypothetical protein Tco_1080548 [Tanacetum coccineum]|uniref:Uncharacterized protein n=1 Tax=Tanacetum coccineum TaxID=301880 RepID=A0ABQ5HWX4_9ASTR